MQATPDQIIRRWRPRPCCAVGKSVIMPHITVTITHCYCCRSVSSPCAHNLSREGPEWMSVVTTVSRKDYTYAKVAHNSAEHARGVRIPGQALPSNRWCASQLDGEIATALHTVTSGGPCGARVIAGIEVLKERGGLVSRITTETEVPEWRKAMRSIGNGDCVEIAPVGGTIAVRDSKDPAGPVLRYSTAAWKAFLSEAGQGVFG